MTRIAIESITFDGGTQVRAALDQDHVASLAEAMTNGATLPPIVLFHDGNAYYIGDGFHRFMAAQRLQWREIDADVRAGAKADALWFALGANRTNGKNMTPADKRHAIVLALQTWPDRSARQLAEQIGVNHDYVNDIRKQVQVSDTRQLPSRVTGKDGKSYPASRPPKAKPAQEKTDMPVGQARTQDARDKRYERAREMAAAGYTTRQMADTFGVGIEGLRVRLRERGVDVPADRVIGKSKRHDSTRIIEHIVMDAENLTADVNLIDFDDLNPQQFQSWIDSLTKSRKALDAFIRQLVKEQQRHGEAA